MLWLGVTAHPTAEWMARQLTVGCGWEPVPRYIIRDRDSVNAGGKMHRFSGAKMHQ